MTETQPTFVAINFIECEAGYRERFETLFASRAHAIDNMPGFQNMMVLKPEEENGPYLVVSHWDSEADFKSWMKSDAFHKGHSRAFGDLQKAREENRPNPMVSTFKTYKVLSR